MAHFHLCPSSGSAPIQVAAVAVYSSNWRMLAASSKGRSLDSNRVEGEDMPSATFMKALPFVLRWEGGYVNHPNDPGGPTNKGVTQKVYSKWLQRQGRADVDVQSLSDADMAAIYE